jgi:flagellar hook-basal body complex protein FliE
MSDAIASVLSQIRSLQQQVDLAARPAEAPAGPQRSFSATLESALRKVNEVQQESRQVAQAFELGDPNADLVKVMIASQQSQIALRATVEVRNRVVQAYQDIMNMPL